MPHGRTCSRTGASLAPAHGASAREVYEFSRGRRPGGVSGPAACTLSLMDHIGVTLDRFGDAMTRSCESGIARTRRNDRKLAADNTNHADLVFCFARVRSVLECESRTLCGRRRLRACRVRQGESPSGLNKMDGGRARSTGRLTLPPRPRRVKRTENNGVLRVTENRLPSPRAQPHLLGQLLSPHHRRSLALCRRPHAENSGHRSRSPGLTRTCSKPT